MQIYHVINKCYINFVNLSLIGTKNIDNGVSINNMVESTKESKGFLVDKESRWKFMEVPYVEDNVNNQKYSKPVIKSEIDEITSNDVLLDAAEFSADLRTDDWNRLATDNGAHNALINIQKESPNTDINISTEYSSTIPFELTKIEKDSWDAINTFDNPGPNNFDLLSYLCDVSLHIRLLISKQILHSSRI